MKHKMKLAKLHRRQVDWANMKGKGDSKSRQRYDSGGYRRPGAIK